ncbi:MAG: ornithine carbamoyltransferase [Thaumarchaeota archaeon]|nr:ornithine carbamoyltransferase [Nitrososphaerota archaeon]MCL5318983.1 ornithine carbamoyltransferase [Nitrososphaerota archaeon]
MSLKGRDILSLAELSSEEITRILDVAAFLKSERKQGRFRQPLVHKTLALIFQKPSTRTRVSFEVAMNDLGGGTVTLSSGEIQITRGETVEDTARTLSRYVDVIMARTNKHSDIVELAEHATVPVINGLSDLYHPSQVLADLQTIRERKGRLEGLNLAWVGDGNNMCNTLLIGCSKTGISITAATPAKYRPYKTAYDTAKRESRKTGGEVKLVEDPKEAVQDADIVVTDTFVSMGDDAAREERLKVFLPRYQVNSKLMSLAKPDAIFMHCLPAHRGEEVTADVIDGEHSVVWDEAENRLHSQKAMLSLLLAEDTALQI